MKTCYFRVEVQFWSWKKPLRKKAKGHKLLAAISSHLFLSKEPIPESPRILMFYIKCSTSHADQMCKLKKNSGQKFCLKYPLSVSIEGFWKYYIESWLNLRFRDEKNSSSWKTTRFFCRKKLTASKARYPSPHLKLTESQWLLPVNNLRTCVSTSTDCNLFRLAVNYKVPRLITTFHLNKVNSSPDCIPSQLLKNLWELAHCTSLSFFQLSRIRPLSCGLERGNNQADLRKKGSRSQIEKYRTITMVCSMSRIFNLVYEHLETNKIFHSSEHGFCRGRSTVTSLA